jgi:hypothetical protein
MLNVVRVAVLRLNEKKIGAIIVLLVASIAPVMILGTLAANALTPPDYQHNTLEDFSISQNMQVNENPSNLNVSFTLHSELRANGVNTIKLNGIAQSGSPGVALTVNGTYVDNAAVPLFEVQRGDCAVVNMIIPFASFPDALSTLHNATVVSVSVYTNQALVYAECSPDTK